MHSVWLLCVLQVCWFCVVFFDTFTSAYNSETWCHLTLSGNLRHHNPVFFACILYFCLCNFLVGQTCSEVTITDFPNKSLDTFTFLPEMWIIPHLCICHRRISSSQFNYLMAARIGEAKNPGPKSAEKDGCLTVAVCNPTAILSRKVEILKLKSQIIFLSETSATKAVQSEFSRNIWENGFRCFFGPPVIPKRTTIDGRESFRGEAIGTAILSKVPSRKSYHNIPTDFLNSCRVNSSVIRIGPYEVLCVAIYGYSGNGPEQKRCNDILLARAYDYVTSCGLPFLIGGDFNVQPQALNAYKNIQRSWNS